MRSGGEMLHNYQILKPLGMGKMREASLAQVAVLDFKDALNSLPQSMHQNAGVGKCSLREETAMDAVSGRSGFRCAWD